MTKVRFMSDLHLEFDDRLRIEPAGEDILVLAGDISTGRTALPFIEHYLNADEGAHVVYILGNHEAYGTLFGKIPDLWSLQDVRDWWTAKAAGHGRLHFLENEEIRIKGLRFLGCSLWTDFRLGPDDHWTAKWFADKGMTDFKVIGWRLSEDQIRRLKPEDTEELCQASAAWLEERLAAPHAEETVVVTHHAPSGRSNEPFEHRHGRSPLAPCFASNMESLMTGDRAPHLWIHGHTHETLDYQVGQTRVLCNPRGYVPDEPNTDFDPDWIIEI